MPSITTDFIVTTGRAGVFVRLVDNADGITTFFSSGATDSNGQFTMLGNPPPGDYQASTSLINGPPWTLYDPHFRIPFTRGDDLSVASLTLSPSGVKTAAAFGADYSGNVRFGAGPLWDVTHPSFAGGAKPDAIELADGNIGAGSRAFSSLTAVFTVLDVGKRLVLEGAGPGGLTYSDLIAAFVDSHHVTMTTNATTAAVNRQFVYGTGAGAAFNAAQAKAITTGRGTPYVPLGNFLVDQQVPTTTGFVYDGSVIYAGLNTARLFIVTGADAVFTGRITYVGMQLATDCFGGISQNNTQFFLHANTRRCALPLANPGVPTMTALAGATNLTNGNYTGLATFVDASGIETGGSGATVAIVAGQQLQYQIAGVPLNVTQVKFYLTSSTGAGATLGLVATVTPVAGTATFVQTILTQAVGGTAVVPGGNATGNVLINMVLNAGCKVDGHYWSVDSAIVRLEGGRDLEAEGVKAGPYTRDPVQYICFIGDIFGSRPQITNAIMRDCHVDGGSLITRGALVVAQAFGGGNHMRNVKCSDLSVDFTISLSDGVDVIQCDQVGLSNINGNAVTNALNVSGCTQVAILGGTAINCRGAGLQIGDSTVAFNTGVVTATGWISVDCGSTFGGAGIILYSPGGGGSTNIVTLMNCMSFKSLQPLMLYGLATAGPGTFSLCSAEGGLYIGNTAGFFDGAAVKPSMVIKNAAGINPLGTAVVTPAFPASTVAVVNNTGFDLMVTIVNGASAMTAVKVNTQTISPSLPAAAVLSFTLPASGNTSFTYPGGAPTWIWYAL